MKRTLFSCCVWLTSLAIPVLAAGVLRAETDCCGQVYSPDEGDCVCPYGEMQSYGECHWYYNHCDPDAEMDQPEDTSACEASVPAETAAEPTPATDSEQFTGEESDYWYDSESGSYHYYEFTDEEIVSNETVDEAIDDLFDFVDAEGTPSDTSDGAEEVATESADTYGYLDAYGDTCYEEDEDGWEYEDGLDYTDESYVEEVCKETEPATTEVVEEVADEPAWQDEEYDYYSEYEDYGWEYGEPSCCPADEVPAVETAEATTATEPAQPSWTESIVEDPWQEKYDYACDDEEYEYRDDDGYDYDAEVTEGTEWDDAVDESADAEVAADAWEDEYYSDYEYWEQEASDVPTAEADDTVATVEEEDSSQLHREAVLSLARSLDRVGSALQNISQQLTDMVAEEVAEGPAAEAIER